MFCHLSPSPSREHDHLLRLCPVQEAFFTLSSLLSTIQIHILIPSATWMRKCSTVGLLGTNVGACALWHPLVSACAVWHGPVEAKNTLRFLVAEGFFSYGQDPAAQNMAVHSNWWNQRNHYPHREHQSGLQEVYAGSVLLSHWSSGSHWRKPGHGESASFHVASR